MGVELALWVGAAVAAAGTAVSVNENRKGRKVQREQNAQTKAANANAEAAARRKAIRSQRVERARLASASQASGVAQSAGEIATASTLNTNFGEQSSNIGGARNSANNAGDLQQQFATTQANAQVGQAVSNLGSSVFSAAAGTESGGKALNNMFG